MIRITFEYPNVETAIVALGKLISAAPTPASQGTGQFTTAPGAAEPTSKRKGRADKGKPRGSYREHAEAITKTPEPAVPMTATEVEARVKESGKSVIKAAEAVVAPLVEATAAILAAAPTASLEDAQAALEKLFAGKGAQAAISVLAVFGVSRLRDLKPEDYAAFIGKAEKAVAE